MGTSNWQNISFDIEVIRTIHPKKILDVGVGFGRWGILCREFLDVWDGRFSPQDWQTEIIGIEAFKEYIQQYHSVFYSRIIHSDVLEYLSSTKETFDLIIIGDVLEHFQKDQGKLFLDLCLSKGKYVLLNVPIGSTWPQEMINGNPYEEHKSRWTNADFTDMPVIIEKRFKDQFYRPFSVFVLSLTEKVLPGRPMYDRTRSMIFVRYPGLKIFLKRLVQRK
jgi:hypothetical protein